MGEVVVVGVVWCVVGAAAGAAWCARRAKARLDRQLFQAVDELERVGEGGPVPVTAPASTVWDRPGGMR